MISKEWFNSKNFNPANFVISVVLVYLRMMFENNKHLGFDVWQEASEDQSTNLSKLVIQDAYTWDTTHRGHQPSIVVNRNIVSFGGGIQDGGQSRVVKAGFGSETSILEIVTVPVILSCIARQDLEAESLAFMTSQFLWDDHRWMKSFQLFGMSSPQISNVRPYNPSDNSFICDVMTSFNAQKRYTTRMLNEQQLLELTIMLNNAIEMKLKTQE